MVSRRLAVLAISAAIFDCSGLYASPIRTDVYSGSGLPDPIVRVREGGFSIPIGSLPFTFGFVFALDPMSVPVVPFNPDPLNCSVGDDASSQLPPGQITLGPEPWVSCGFQNRTGGPIQALDFLYSNQNPPYNAEALAFFTSAGATATTAQFSDGLIPPCVFDGEFCFGGEFLIDWVGYADGSDIRMTATSTPEPAALLLVGAGVALAGLRRRQRQQ